jgi:hypothetical protein
MENVLTSLAFFDAKHDFDDYAEMYRSEIADSLPGKIFEIASEEEALHGASKYAETIKPLEGVTPNELFISLGGSATIPVAIVCDASFCSYLIKLLQMNTIGKVYFVLNREVLNDPASTGIPVEGGALSIAHDIQSKPVKYNEYASDNIVRTPNLHSKFKIELEFNTKGKVITKTLLDGRKVEITEGSVPNEIGSILSDIFDKNNTLLTQSAFTRKRAGDWLQALSCLDTKRLYLINNVPKNLKGCKIYFCSSDRVAISFALYNDISCLLKRDSLYFVYDSIKLPSMDNYGLKKKLKGLRANVSTVIPHLSECVSTIEMLKEEWKTILLEIKAATSFEQVKKLTTVGFHYRSLCDRYSNEFIEDIKRFIANPYDSMFDEEYHTTNNMISEIVYIDKVVKSYRYLNVYDTTVEEKYYGLFDFGNNDPTKFDMVCGGSLMTLLLHSCIPELVNFALDAMEKIIELSDHNVELTTLYTLVIEVNHDYIETTLGVSQRGGALSTSPATLQWIGDYLAHWQFPGKGGVGTIYLSEYHNLTTGFRQSNDVILEYLVYEKQIVPKKYNEYLAFMNSFYPPGEGPRQKIADFLKRNFLKNKRKSRRSKLADRKRYTKRR